MLNIWEIPYSNLDPQTG